MEQQAQAMPGEIQIILRCPPRPLLDARHRLPIVRLQAALHSPELEAGNLAGGVWKAPDLVSGVPEPDQRLFGHSLVYKNLDAGRSPMTV